MGERVFESAVLSSPAIVLHGGAGTFERVNSPEDEAVLAEAMSVALDAVWKLLETGGSAVEAVVAGVSSLEDSGVFNAGRSGTRTVDGILELDAAVMDGATGSFGGVLATTFPRNPVRAALAVSLLGGPSNGPVLLAGVGADSFAAESGLPEMTPGSTARKGSGPTPVSEAGTVGAVAVDANGHVAAATSTGGRQGQRRGRVGDSPIPGAGTWADDETVAVSATGEGEAFVVAGFAHAVDRALRNGATLGDAIAASMSDVARRGGEGGSISIRPDGEMICAFDTLAMARAWRDATSTTIAVLKR